MSDNKVRVVADENGNVIRQSRNPEIGYIVLRQEQDEISKSGWINTKTRTALLKGTIDQLKNQKLRKNSTLPGKIVVFETTTPLSSLDPERGLKRAGKDGIICCTADGEPIYRETYWDPTGEDTDTMIAHANGDAIREANAAKAEETEPAEETEKEYSAIDFSSAPGMQEEEEEDETVDETVDEVDEDMDDDIDDVEDEVEEFEEEDFEL